MLLVDADTAREICWVIRDLPPDVRRFAQRVVFVGLPEAESEYLAMAKWKATGSDEMRLIHIFAGWFRQAPVVRRWILAHELAHLWLQHPDPADDEELRERCEREADEQSAEWGFPAWHELVEQ